TVPPSITARHRLRYWFDNTLARGPVALIGWLSVASLVLILVFGAIVVVTGLDPDNRNFADVTWAGLMRTLDAGTMGGDAGSWPFLFISLAVTLVGIFIVSTLIGVLTTGIEGKLDDLRKGRSFVAEEGHTVILGWSSQVFTVVSELVLANENQKRACVAILADKDAAEMLDELAARVPNTRTTRVVCRSGSPADPADLEIVNPHAARSMIVLAPETADPDAEVIKTILAVTNGPNRRAEPYHMVAVIRDRRNMDVAKMVGGDEVQLVLAGDLIARVTAQTCRQSGLSVAYTELMDYGGDEIYFTSEPGLTGKSFAEATAAYEDSTVIGLRYSDGRIQLNPPMETAVGAADKLIVIAEDDDTIKLSGRRGGDVDEGAIRSAEPTPLAPEQTLLLGWNERAEQILRELDEYVTPGSTARVVTGETFAALAAAAFEADPPENLAVTVQPGDTTDRRTLDALGVTAYDHIIVLSTLEEGMDLQQADARTLITLLHLRDIADRGDHDLAIVSEMLDLRNRELAQVTRADDFIVSDNLVSLLLAQVSENKELAAVFSDLFDPEGSEIYLKPAADYVEPGHAVTFYTVLESARRRGQVAIGYRIQSEAHDAGSSFGVHINPKKSAHFSLSAEDRVIVLAED
ncbi:MAG TPA: hypothetical protein VK610_05475, partial [Rhodothermales bacterium]|nr:hypothetical protein [Rhodothermales bacterium]